MSLDISLYAKDQDGNEINVWGANITHNLNTMADKAGLYRVMWRPEEIGVRTAREALPILELGIRNLKNNKAEMEKLNPENGWGSYDGLLKVSSEYYEKCKQYPSAEIDVSR